MEGPGVYPDGPLGQLLGVLVQQVLLQAQEALQRHYRGVSKAFKDVNKKLLRFSKVSVKCQ